MEYENIKKLMDDMGNSKLTSIEIDFPDGTKIRMKKEDEKPVLTQNIIENKIKELENDNKETTANKNYNEHLNQNANENINSNQNENQEEEKGNIVTSPMVGTFYIKPAPTAEPFVQIDTQVKEGDTLCIIEAMKLMNEIQSDYSGKITEIFVEDGMPVEYGTKLFRIE